MWVIVFLILFLALPWLLGTLIERLGKNAARFQAARGATAVFRLLAGYFSMWAVFQIIAVPCILLKTAFHTAVRCWMVILILLSLFSIALRVKETTCSQAFYSRTADYRTKISRHSDGGTRKAEICILITLACIGIAWQCTHYMAGMHVDDDDSRFIVNAVIAYEHDKMLLENPATGEIMPRPEGELVKDVVSPWSLYMAMLAKLVGIHPTIMAHSILAPWLLFIRYLVIWAAGCLLFQKTQHRQTSGFPADCDSKKTDWGDLEKAAWFLLFLVVGTQFFGGSIYSSAAFALSRIWQGKAVLAGVMIPWLLLISFGSEETWEHPPYLLLIMTGFAASLLSGMGIIMTGAVFAVYALWHGWRTRKIVHFAGIILCAGPCLLYGLLYMYLK